jgi:hypothetical protein
MAEQELGIGAATNMPAGDIAAAVEHMPPTAAQWLGYAYVRTDRRALAGPAFAAYLAAATRGDDTAAQVTVLARAAAVVGTARVQAMDMAARNAAPASTGK